MTESSVLRALRDEDEEKEWWSHVHYAFAPHRRPRDRSTQEFEDMEMAEKKALFSDGRMVSICGLLNFRGQLRGTQVPIGGVGPVATPPGYRRRGHAREMLRQLVQQMRQRGICTSALWPFYSRFYESLGWAVSAESSGFKFSPADLRRVVPETCPDGQFRHVSHDDVQMLDEIYRRWAAHYDLTVERPAQWWRQAVMAGWDDRRYSFVYLNACGEPSAYVIFVIKGSDEDNLTLSVRDYAYADLSGYRALLRFLLDHDSQVISYRIDTPRTDPLYDWFATGEVRRHRGIMFRIVDVPGALQMLSYPRELSGTATVAVVDELCGGNDDCFELAVSDGRLQMRSRPVAQPDLCIHIRHLSQLFAGYRSLPQLVRSAGAELAESPGAELLRNMFPARETYMPEDF